MFSWVEADTFILGLSRKCALSASRVRTLGLATAHSQPRDSALAALRLRTRKTTPLLVLLQKMQNTAIPSGKPPPENVKPQD